MSDIDDLLDEFARDILAEVALKLKQDVIVELTEPTKETKAQVLALVREAKPEKMKSIRAEYIKPQNHSAQIGYIGGYNKALDDYEANLIKLFKEKP